MAAIRERKTAAGKTRWHVQIRMQHVAETKSFDRLGDARDWAAHTERLIKTGKFRLVNEAKVRRFSELCTRFKNGYMRASRQKDYTQILAWWESRLGRLSLEDVTTERIQICVNELLDSPKSARRKLSTQASNPPAFRTPVHQVFGMAAIPTPTRAEMPGSAAQKTSAGTVLRYLAVLTRVFSVAVIKLKWLESSPTDGVERPSGPPIQPPRVLTPAEEVALLVEVDASENRYLQIVVRIGLRTGMRMMEIMRLRWNDITFHEGHANILIQVTKNKRQRFVPLAGDALEAVLRLRVPLSDNQGEALLFPSKNDKNKPVQIRKAWATCLARAGIKRFRFHDLRHTFGGRAADKNYSLPRIGALMGHRDTRSTQIYTHFSQDDAVEMVTALASAASEAMAKSKLGK